MQVTNNTNPVTKTNHQKDACITSLEGKVIGIYEEKKQLGCPYLSSTQVVNALLRPGERPSLKQLAFTAVLVDLPQNPQQKICFPPDLSTLDAFFDGSGRPKGPAAMQAMRLLALTMEQNKSILDLNLNGKASFRTDIDDHTLALLCHKLPNVKRLRLANCNKLSEFGIGTCIHKLGSNLELLDLSGIFHQLFFKRELIEIRRKCPRLTHLILKKSYFRKEHAKHLLSDDSKLVENVLPTKEIIPTSIKLTHLNLHHCFEVRPEAIRILMLQCSALTHLDLGGCLSMFGRNEATQAIAKHGGMLTYFNFSRSDLTDRELVAIAKGCGQLRYLNVSYCWRITDQGVRAIVNNCAFLKELVLERCDRITGGIVGETEGAGLNLATLNLGECEGVHDNSLKKAVCQFPNLTNLSIERCIGVAKKGFGAIAQHCRKLRHLNVSRCSFFTDAHLVNIVKNCSQLASLKLDHTSVTGSCFKELMNLGTQDTEFYVGSGDSMTIEGWISFGHYGCKSRTLRLTNPSITDNKLKAMLMSHPNLTELAISNCPKLTKEGWQAISECSQLTRLSLHHCLIGGSELQAIALNCYWLNAITIEHCPLIDGQHLQLFAKACPNLTELHLANLPQLTSNELAKLATHCPRLVYLTLFDCDQVDDAALHAIVKQCPNLYGLGVRGNHSLKDICPGNLKNHYPFLEPLRTTIIDP